MTIYCIDTSALIAAWQERYPPENFPRFWGLMDLLIEDGRLVAPTEVLTETAKRSDELHKWLAERKHMFRELEDKIQVAAAGVLAQFPRLEPDSKDNYRASRRIAIWIDARTTKVCSVVARFSQSLARRRLRPNHENVLSTTQRRGSRTKPFVSSLRLTISMRSEGTLATAVVT